MIACGEAVSRWLDAEPAGEAATSAAAGQLAGALCELATDGDPELRELGQRLLFTVMAERLGDAFDPEAVRLYDRLFAAVIDRCRHRPDARSLDTLLQRFGLETTDDLLARKARTARSTGTAAGTGSRVGKVFVLSRVTVGADVAVTSLVLQQARAAFPEAETVLLGPPSLRELFGGMPGLRTVDVDYERRGGLLGRLQTWARLVEAIDRETADLAGGRGLVVDPDSRLTQLGLLPVAGASLAGVFFESRSYRRPGLTSLGQLTAAWLFETFGRPAGEDLYPQIALHPAQVAAARAAIGRLRDDGARPVVAINWGVGGNARKRLDPRFEIEVVRGLLDDGRAVVLDRGIGDEVPRMEALLRALAQDGRRVVEVGAADLEGRAADRPLACDVLAYQGGLGPFAALVSHCDLYVGYDSAFQHIAAAASVPLVDVFVEAPSPTFVERWRPHSRAPVRTVVVTSRDGHQETAVLARCRELRRS